MRTFIKFKEKLYNLNIVQQIFKEEDNKIIFYYSLEQEKYEDYSTLEFSSKEERDKMFLKIEKILTGEKNEI